MAVWPNFIEPKLSNRFMAIMMKRLKDRKPRPFQSIEIQEFSLGLSPPILGLQRTYWSTAGDQPVMHMGFEWDTNEMSVLLAAKLAKPLRGMARIVISSIHLKGDVRALLKRVQSLAEEGDPEEIFQSLDELESVEAEQEAYMLQLQREKMAMLAKINELDKVINGLR